MERKPQPDGVLERKRRALRLLLLLIALFIFCMLILIGAVSFRGWI